MDAPVISKTRADDWGTDKDTDPISYRAAHDRVKKIKGKASAHPCVECGAPARDWAYASGDPDELYGPTSKGASWCRYSRDPSYYEAMCRSCHLGRDKKDNERELKEFRLWKERNRRRPVWGNGAWIEAADA